MKCQNCNKHEGTIKWVGEGSTMDFIHGNYEQWCECCALKTQILHAKQIMKNLPKLERKLLRSKCK